MRNLYAIYRKEMGHYFVSPVAYIVVGVFLILSGFFFSRIMEAVIQEALEAAMQGMQFGGAMPMDVPGIVLRGFFNVISFFLLLFTPALTMGVYAEERRRGTMELLMTSPVTDGQIVLGKFFASLSLYMIMLLPTLGYAVYMFLHSDPAPPWKLLFAGYLGAVLLGGALLAVGSFLSSLTESQLIAAILTFGVFILLWVIEFAARGGSGDVSALFQYLSVTRHFDDFSRGVIDTSGVVFYVSLAALGIFLTMRSVDSMRWRRA
jgi:ABC-2 type transport system permease protein